MANKKISELNEADEPLKSSDWMELSYDNGGGFESKKISMQYMHEGFYSLNSYISAYSTQPQTFGGGTPTEILFDGTGFSNFINLPHPYAIETVRAGFYQLDFTATILNNGGNPNYKIGFYLTINGSDVADSSKFMNAPDNNHHISFQTSWLVQMGASDVVSIICIMEKANFELITESAFTGVLTPSAQVIMKRIG